MKAQANTTNTAAQPAAEAAKPVDPAVQAITNAVKAQMKAAITTLKDSETKRNDLKSELDTKNEQFFGARNDLLVTLVKFVDEHDYPVNYAMQGVDAAIAEWSKGKNVLKDNTLTQFRGEIERAIHPLARKHVVSDLATAKKLWEAETAAVNKAQAEAKAAETKFDRSAVPTPLHDAFARSSQVVLQAGGICEGRAKESPVVDDMSAYCATRIRSQKRDPKIGKRLLKRALESLEGLAVEFPDDGSDDVAWGDVLDYLRNLDLDALAKKRDAREKGARGKANLRKRNAQRSGKGDATDNLLDDPDA